MANNPQNPSGIGDLLNDANGVAITVGATVKFVGTVLSVNPLSTHFRDIQVQLSHPITGVANPKSTTSEGAHATQSGALPLLSVPACMLVVGS